MGLHDNFTHELVKVSPLKTLDEFLSLGKSWVFRDLDFIEYVISEVSVFLRLIDHV